MQTNKSTKAGERTLTHREEFMIISEIGNRALELYADHGIEDDKMTVVMDVDNAHKCIPIDLVALRDSDPVTFAHDIGGIRRHINRETGKLENCFVPRTAMKELAA